MKNRCYLPRGTIEVDFDAILVPREGNVRGAVSHAAEYELGAFPYFWPLVHDESLKYILFTI